jgi:tRNA threonylcarbamoyladenosine biosynthesis protein TsaE
VTPPDLDTPALRRRTRGPDGTRAVAADLARALRDEVGLGFVVALRGDLGAGKTVFVQGLAAALGVDQAPSPTFTIARSYPLAGGGTLHHVDAYRLTGPGALEAAGFEEMRGPGCLTCVEWAERVLAALPEERIDVTLSLLEDEVVARGGVPLGREIALAAVGPRARTVLARMPRGDEGR